MLRHSFVLKQSDFVIRLKVFSPTEIFCVTNIWYLAFTIFSFFGYWKYHSEEVDNFNFNFYIIWIYVTDDSFSVSCFTNTTILVSIGVFREMFGTGEFVSLARGDARSWCAFENSNDSIIPGTRHMWTAFTSIIKTSYSATVLSVFKVVWIVLIGY